MISLFRWATPGGLWVATTCPCPLRQSGTLPHGEKYVDLVPESDCLFSKLEALKGKPEFDRVRSITGKQVELGRFTAKLRPRMKKILEERLHEKCDTNHATRSRRIASPKRWRKMKWSRSHGDLDHPREFFRSMTVSSTWMNSSVNLSYRLKRWVPAKQSRCRVLRMFCFCYRHSLMQPAFIYAV